MVLSLSPSFCDGKTCLPIKSPDLPTQQEHPNTFQYTHMIYSVSSTISASVMTTTNFN